MLPESLMLQLVTPERELVRESAREVQLPGRDGYLGILPGHAPLITELGIGELSYRTTDATHYTTIISGYAEVLPDRVIVLAEVAERAEEIDLERARAAYDRAHKRLATPAAPDVDWDRATLALERAMIRLQVAAKGGAASGAQEERRGAP